MGKFHVRFPTEKGKTLIFGELEYCEEEEEKI